jgi:gamma-glutamyltranspeptidase
VKELVRMGHNVTRLQKGVYKSGVETIVRKEDGWMYAASDGRKGAIAAGW